MLVLKRNEGQWIEIRHRSGERIRIRTYNIRGQRPGQVDLAFEDPDHHFQVHREERSRPRRDVQSAPPLAAFMSAARR